MGGVWAVARTELGRNLPRFAALAVLVALAGGVVTAAVLGADRSRTSLDRFIAATNPADVAAFSEDRAVLDGVGAVPGVRRATAFDLVAVVPRSVAERSDVFLPMLAAEDGRVPYELNGVRVLEGQLPDPASRDEIALHEATADLLGVGVGDPLAMETYTPADVDALLGRGGQGVAPSGPDFTLRVAALVRDPVDVVSRPGDIVLTPLTPGVVEAHGASAGTFGFGSLVELHPGVSVEEFTASARDADLPISIERWVGADPARDTGFGPTLDVIGDGLVALAVVVGVVAAFTLGQALHRRALATREASATLAAFGMTRRGLAAAVTAPVAAVAVLGSLGVAVTAHLASARFPIGIARRAEPSPGARWDAAILAGAALTAVTVLVLGAAASWAALRTRPGPLPAARGTWVLGPAGRAVASGIRRSGRSARAAVALAVAGVVGAVVFAASLDGLLASPERYGWGFDTAVAADNFDSTELTDPDALDRDPAVAEATEAIFQIDVDVDGSPVFGYAIGDGTGDIAPVVATGRAPRQADEVALGRETLERVGKSVGDRVLLTTTTGSAEYEVVGQAVIPVSQDGNVGVSDGVTFSVPAAARIRVSPSCTDGASCYRQTAVRFVDGADLAAAARRLLVDPRAGFERPRPPAEVERLTEVEGVPWVVAGLMAALAVAATVHAIVELVGRRRRDLAVLRALGVTPRGNRRAVVASSTVLVSGAAVLGTVGGLVVGRSLWRAVAGAVGVVATPEVPPAIAALPFVAVLLAVAAAVLPARRAGRVRPSDLLRAE